MDLEKAIDDFLSYMKAEKAASIHTIEAYSRDLLRLKSMASNESIHHVEGLCWKRIDFWSNQTKSIWADNTRVRWIKAVRSFLKFCRKEGWLEKDEASQLLLPKVWQSLPRVWSVEIVGKLIDSIPQNTLEESRDRAFFEMLYGCGLRVSEACQLNLKDVQDQSVRVRGKGRKERIVPLGKSALETLDYYLGSFRNDTEEALFIRPNGKRVTRGMMWHRLNRYVEKSFSSSGSPHTFRHSYATHLMQGGVDVRVIQELLGHASISTTDRYTHVNSAHLQKAFDQYHPRH